MYSLMCQLSRVHRLGQTKEVFVKRLMINNTVEQRICELQEKKMMITNNALGEGGGASKSWFLIIIKLCRVSHELADCL